MRRPDRLSLVLLACCCIAALALIWILDEGLGEWLFYSLTLATATALARAVIEGWADAGREAARAEDLAGARPDEVALAAVHEERRRLHADITARLRTALGTIAALALAARESENPSRSIGAIQLQAREASVELRRELGLLRDPNDAHHGAARETATALSRRQIVSGLLVAALAVAESIVWPLADGRTVSLTSMVLTALAASAFMGRVVAPGASAAFVGVMYAVTVLGGEPITPGFWYLLTVGALTWAIAVREPARATDAAGLAVMGAGIAFGTARLDPDNLGVNLVTLVAVLVAGLTVRVSRRRGSTAREAGDARAAVLRRAALVAVEAERSSFARDLHDAVSHAVGLVAVQAGAAQVSWPSDPAAVTAALDIIAATASSTVAELDRMRPSAEARPRTAGDLEALVERVRSAGTVVHMHGSGSLPPSAADVAFRVTQEALTNVVRHAPGAQAWVACEASDGQLRVSVRDDGPGAEAGRERGFGLVGLAERVQLAGGDFRCGPGERGGFAIEATLPLRGEVAP